MTDWEDDLHVPTPHSDIAQAVVHLNRFRETGKLQDLRICNTLLQKYLVDLEISNRDIDQMPYTKNDVDELLRKMNQNCS